MYYFSTQFLFSVPSVTSSIFSTMFIVALGFKYSE